MQITSTSTSFNARISGQYYSSYDRRTGDRIRKETSYNSMLESYDSQIRRIEEEKAKAIELDTFVRTDKKVRELIKKLPNEDTLEICNNLTVTESSDKSEIEFGDLALSYHSGKLEDEVSDNETFMFVQDKDGEIDKKGIISWLEKIVGYFE